MKYLIVVVFFYSLFSSQVLQAKACFTETDVIAEIVNANESENGEADEIRIRIKDNNLNIIVEPLLEYSSLEDVLSFIDIDFDGKKEILIKYDNDPSHSVTHSVIKIKCSTLEEHPLIPELGFYEIDNNKKELITYFSEGFRNGEKRYCFNPDGYLCSKELAITNQISLLKEYDSNGETVFQGAVNTDSPKQKLTFKVNKKTYLYNSSNKTKMYLIKDDKVTLLDEKTDDSGQAWYFINFKGTKDLNMWIKAEAVDIPETNNTSDQKKTEPEAQVTEKTVIPKSTTTVKEEKSPTPIIPTVEIKKASSERTNLPQIKEKNSAGGSISLALLTSFLGLFAFKLS